MISLNVVIWDETAVIDRCLKTAQPFVDEIVLMVDDSCRFVDRLLEYTDNVLYSRLANSIVEHHRNKLIEASNHPWILVMDPDEFLGQSLGPCLRKYCQIADVHDPPIDGYWISRYNIVYDDDYNLQVGTDYPDWNLRFFRKHARYSGTIYEDSKHLGNHPNPLGLERTQYIPDGILYHDKTYENIEEVNRTIALYKKWQSSQSR